VAKTRERDQQARPAAVVAVRHGYGLLLKAEQAMPRPAMASLLNSPKALSARPSTDLLVWSITAIGSVSGHAALEGPPFATRRRDTRISRGGGNSPPG
jgi:hypothetical protein